MESKEISVGELEVLARLGRSKRPVHLRDLACCGYDSLRSSVDRGFVCELSRRAESATRKSYRLTEDGADKLSRALALINLGLHSVAQMYTLLGMMVENAEKGNKERVLELNKVCNLLARIGGYPWPRTNLDLAYDNVMESCVFYVDERDAYKELHERFLADARKGYDNLPEPRLN